MNYKNPYFYEWKVKGRPGFLEIFASVLKRDNRIDDYDFFQKLFINFSFPYTLSKESIHFLLDILEHSDKIEIVKIVIELLNNYILNNEKNKKKIILNGLLDACIFRLLNKDTENCFIELFELIKTANIPNELTKLQCLIFSRIFETCFDIYRNDSNKINKVFECFNTFLESEFFVYTFTKDYSIYPLLKFLNPLLKGVSPETITHVLNAINSMIKYRTILDDLVKTPIIKFLLHQIQNKNFDITKASYKLLLRLSNNDSLINDFLKEWGSMHVSSVIKNKNIDLLYPVVLLVKKLLMKGKINEKNNKIHSDVIISKFNSMREEKRKETGNKTDYCVIGKKLENKVSEFHPAVYNLDNLDQAINIPDDEDDRNIDENEEDDIELIPSEKSLEEIEEKVQEEIKEQEEEINEKNDEIEPIPIEEEMDKEKERLRREEEERIKESHRENMLKKYGINTNAEVVTNDKIENVNIDDEWNKINKNNDEDTKNLMNDKRNMNEKMMELHKKFLNKGNITNINKSDVNKSSINIKSTNEIDIIDDNENAIYEKNKTNKIKKDKYKSNKNDNNNINKNNMNNIKLTENNKLPDLDEINKSDQIKDSNESSELSSNDMNEFDINDSLHNLNDNYDINNDNINIISDNDLNNNEDGNIKNDDKESEINISDNKGKLSKEAVDYVINKIKTAMNSMEMKNEDIFSVKKFLDELEFNIKKDKNENEQENSDDEKNDIEYLVNKEILIKFFNDVNEMNVVYMKNENIKNFIFEKYGDELSKVNLLDVYKKKLINELYNSDAMTNFELSFLEYLINQQELKKKNNKVNRSMILDLFEEDSDDIYDDLFNECITTLRYQANEKEKNDLKKKHIKNIKKNPKIKLLKRKITDKKISSMKNKQKKVYEEYQNGLQKRKQKLKKINYKNDQFMEKNFSDINLEKDLKPIEEMDEVFFAQKLQGNMKE